MSKEQYVTYETAELLKEKGFDWECYAHYNLVEQAFEEHSVTVISHTNKNSTLGPFWISAPTQQMACRWLREEKNIDIEPFVYCNHHDGSRDYGCNIQQNGHLLMTESFVHDTFEDAVEAALQYCLKNII